MNALAGDFLFYNEEKGVRMDFGKVVNDIKTKFNLSDDQCQKVTDIFGKFFGPGQDNKDKIAGLLKDKVKLDDEKANGVYDAVAGFFSGDVMDKVKGLFGK